MTWRTSSHSASGGNCVEVSTGPRVGVRDTKARDLGHFTVSPTAWTVFLGQLQENTVPEHLCD